jgi:uncharacterized membrane protein YphA (DoxX/SURF4 family)
VNLVLWIVTVALALFFLGAGTMKLTKSKESLLENPRMAWTEDFDPKLLRTIGGLEVLGAIGLILPAVTGIATFLVPLAATGLAITMIGAAITHARRHETRQVISNVVLLALLLLVAWGRFGPYAFGI